MNSPRPIRLTQYLGLIGLLGSALVIILPAAILSLPEQLVELSGRDVFSALLGGTVLALPIAIAYLWTGFRHPELSSVYDLSRTSRKLSLTFFTSWFYLLGASALAVSFLSEASAYILKLAWVPIIEFTGVSLSDAPVWLNGAAQWLLTCLLLGFFPFLKHISGRVLRSLVWASGIGLIAIPTYYLYPFDQLSTSFPSQSTLGRSLPSAALIGTMLWCLPPILRQRALARNPTRDLPLGLGLAWISGLASLTLLVAFSLQASARHPLHLASTLITQKAPQWAIAALITIIALIGFRELSALVRRLFESMCEDGFFGANLRNRVNERPPQALFFWAMLVLALLPQNLNLILSAVGLYTATLFVFGNDALSQGNKERIVPLPLSLLVSSLSIYGLFALPSPRIQVLLFMGLSGVALYVILGRRGELEARSDTLSVDSGPSLDPERYRVLVPMRTLGDLDNTLPVARKLVADRNGEIVVLAFRPLSNLHSHIRQRLTAQRTLDHLAKTLGEPDLIRVVIRLAPDIATAAIAAASELYANTLVAPMAWRDDDEYDEIEDFFELSGVELLIVSGATQEPLRVVTGAKVPHGRGSVMGIAARLAAGSRLTIYGNPTDLDATDTETLSGVEVERITEAKTNPARLSALAGNDLLVLPATADPFLKRSFYGGIPFQIATRRSGPTIIVRPGEKVALYWLRQIWDALVRFLPELDASDRSSLALKMRDDANASRSFLSLMTLATIIATGGLIQDSGAVVIGAMLVAPLMSPILGSAFGIVTGSSQLSRRALFSVAKGASISIGIATLLVLILPNQDPTSQVLARTQPTLIDLLVALAAGAAGVYSTADKSSSSALPGVAVAVSLVPPLCTVGVGLGMGQFEIAFGAMMLFLTNFASIVLMGIIIFALLGFRPNVRSADKALTGVRFTLAGIAVLAVPLFFLSLRTIELARIQSDLHLVNLGDAEQTWIIRDVAASRKQGSIVVNATVVSSRATNKDDIVDLAKRLQAATTKDVRIEITALNGQSYSFVGDVLTERFKRIEEKPPTELLPDLP